MSVDCRILTGLTIEFARDLTSEDFQKCEAFIEKHPELDEYEYHSLDREGKLLLIGDGMSGDFLRLIKVDKYIAGGYLGDTNEFFELTTPAASFDPELIAKMKELYEEYTGKSFNPSELKYAMWSQWQQSKYLKIIYKNSKGLYTLSVYKPLFLCYNIYVS